MQSPLLLSENLFSDFRKSLHAKLSGNHENLRENLGGKFCDFVFAKIFTLPKVFAKICVR
jgi:hypothetical protein